MSNNGFPTVESPENYEQKCLCVFVLDDSKSMSGEPIRELNNGLSEFMDEIKHDSIIANRLELSILTFGNRVDTVLEPSLVTQAEVPELTARQPSTRLVDAIRTGMQIIASRKEWYRRTSQPYYRPWLIAITDGAPNPDQDVEGVSDEIRRASRDKKLRFFAVGVSSADMETLTQISSPDVPPAPLKGLSFGEFFEWLSRSIEDLTNPDGGDERAPQGDAGWLTGFPVT